MNKIEFLSALKIGLEGLPEKDIAESLEFYSEMIDDAVNEDGVSEEEAVAKIGPVEEVVSQIIGDTPITRIVKEKIAPKRAVKAWEIILIVLGFPIWFPLLVSLFAVLISIYAVILAVGVSLWAADLSLAVCLPAGIAASVYSFLSGNAGNGVYLIGAGLFCAGLAIFLFYACRAYSKFAYHFPGKCILGFKKLIIGKESRQ